VLEPPGDPEAHAHAAHLDDIAHCGGAVALDVHVNFAADIGACHIACTDQYLVFAVRIDYLRITKNCFSRQSDSTRSIQKDLRTIRNHCCTWCYQMHDQKHTG